ncbi:MAG: FtsX-like permease family protein [Bradyrhizobium sp.]|nr:MAG: FtsX-like permease family protein [Bradyrhizobium sp.]
MRDIASPRPRGPRFTLFRFALRDLRGGMAGLRIVVLCVALGVTAIVGVNSLARSLEAGLARDGRTILGGDVSFSLMSREPTQEEHAFLAGQGALSTVATFRAMARTSGGEATLVEAKAVEETWPNLGAAVFDPAMTQAALFARDGDAFGAAVEPALIDRLGLKLGDRLDIGFAHFILRARLVSEPDRLATGVGFGPRVLMSQEALRATGLVQPGALIRWTTRVLLGGGAPPDEAAVDALVETAKAAFPQAGWEARTRANVSPDFARDLDRFGQFLTLVGLVALIVGGVGVANAAQGFVERKQATLAILKALGASGGGAVALAMTEFMIVALIGVTIGLALGALAPFAINALFADALPLPLAPAIFPRELALGAAYGVLTALAFSIGPLGRAHDAPVAQLFRALVEPSRAPTRWRYRLAAALAALALGALAVIAGPQRGVALVVVVAVAIALVALRLVAALAMMLAKRAPRPSSVVWRLALANLHRPGALTPSVVISLGLGLAALVALTLVDFNLRAQLHRGEPGATPNFYFLDVRSSEIDAFRHFLSETAPGAKIVEAPMMRGRIVRIGDTPAAHVKAKESAAWALEGDRGVTFAAAPPEGSKLVAGEWWSADYSGPPLVSVEAGVADGLGVKLGDFVTLNVLGRDVTARVANLRRVDWRSFAINFVFVFSPNTFSGAPYSGLFTAALPPAAGEASEAALMKATARDFPGVVAIPVREALATIEALTAKLALAIRSASGVALASAVLVLAGALAASRRARIADVVVLKILGATRMRLIASFLAEYVLLGAFAAVFGAAAGALAAYVIVADIMGFDFTFAPQPAVAAIAAGLTLTVALGMIGAWRILGRKPAAFLREL